MEGGDGRLFERISALLPEIERAKDLGWPTSVFGEPWLRFWRLLSTVERQGVLNEAESWLDLGCHQGQLLELLHALHPDRPALFGSDNWTPTSTKKRNWQYIQTNLENDFGFPGYRFDVISALEIIEHMIDTDGFLDRCRESLVEKGLLLLTTPNINSLGNRLRLAVGRYPSGPEHRTVIHHVRIYNVGKLREHLSARGFEVLKIEGVGFLPQRCVRSGSTARLTGRLAGLWPEGCANIIAIARRA